MARYEPCLRGRVWELWVCHVHTWLLTVELRGWSPETCCQQTLSSTLCLAQDPDGSSQGIVAWRPQAWLDVLMCVLVSQKLPVPCVFSSSALGVHLESCLDPGHIFPVTAIYFQSLWAQRINPLGPWVLGVEHHFQDTWSSVWELEDPRSFCYLCKQMWEKPLPPDLFNYCDMDTLLSLFWMNLLQALDPVP
jgi:hypothetical protein